jgi:ElaB/YqjD/DUF883 family membrane-anchored ribosome-binding protein
MKRPNHPRRRLGVAALVGLLLVTALPVGVAVAEPAQDARPLQTVIERLSETLQRLEGELAALEGPRAERLEEKIEAAVEAIGGILDAPRQGGDEAEGQGVLVRINLELHRLLQVLEEIVESSATIPERPDAEETIEDLRVRLDSLILEASVGMSSEEYEQLEDAVYRTAHMLGRRIADLAKKVEPRTAFPALARLVEQLEGLLFRLDGFVLRHAPQRP